MQRVTEQEIQRHICDYLDTIGVLWWRCNLGGVRRSGKGWTPNPMKGFPDLAGLTEAGQGRLFAIEVKRPGEVPEPHQADWHRKLAARGALVIVASSVSEVRNALEGASLAAAGH